MEKTNEHIDLSSLRAKVQKLLNWDPGTMNPEIFKKETLELLYEYEQCQLRLENQYQELTQIREEAEKVAREKYDHLFKIINELRSLTAHLYHEQEEERLRISREIHDELGQQLTGIKLYASWLKGQIEIDSKEKAERVNRLIESVDMTIENVRRIATTLRPGVLDDLGLEAAVEWLCAQYQRQTGIKCTFETTNVSPGYNDAINTAFYRIFQETLINVTKHAKATEVRTILKEELNCLTLIVMDNGKGIEANNGNDKHSLGITGMKERARMLNGVLSIKRRKEGGTIMSVSIPLKN